MTVTAHWLQNEDYPASSDRQVLCALTAKDDAGVCRDGVYGTQELAVSAPGGVMAVTVAPGSANVDQYIVSSDEATTMPIDVGSGGTRTDLIVLRVYDEEAGDGTSEAAIEVVKGTSSTEPALPDRAIRLAAISVSASASTIGPENVTDRRQFSAAAGGLIHLPGGLASTPTVPNGQAIWDPTAHRIGVNDAGVWRQFVDISAIKSTDTTHYTKESGATSVSDYRLNITGNVAVLYFAFVNAVDVSDATVNILTVDVATLGISLPTNTPGFFPTDGGNGYAMGIIDGSGRVTTRDVIVGGGGSAISAGATFHASLIIPLL